MFSQHSQKRPGDIVIAGSRTFVIDENGRHQPVPAGVRAASVAALEAAGQPPLANPFGAERYLIWSNEHRAWWAPDGRGYTRRIDGAGRYDRAEAMLIAATRGGGWPNDGNPFEIAIPEADAVEQARPSRLKVDAHEQKGVR